MDLAAAQPTDDQWISIVSAIVVGAVALVGATMARKSAKDANYASEFDAIGNISVQIAEKILAQSEIVKDGERHDCDQKIALLRDQFAQEAARLQAEIDDCDRERNKITAVLIDAGLMEPPTNP